jgi:hypothetical protein
VVLFDGGEHSPWRIGCIKYDAYLWYVTANDGELLLLWVDSLGARLHQQDLNRSP